MKNVLMLGLLLTTMMSCVGSQPAPGVTGTVPATCTYPDINPPAGLYCTSNNVYAALESGMCNSPSDCPNPYNFCDAKNHCQVQLAQTGSSQIWFATDAIRPGVTVLNAGNDYIYNIMAKGYASLDDWCMSQAQQSSLPAMRNIGSWRALIIGQPDNQTPVQNLSHKGLERYSTLTNIPTVTGPSGSAFSPSTYPAIEDRNGIIIANGNTSIYWQQGAWTGISRSYCQGVVCDGIGSCDALTNSNGQGCCNIDDGWNACQGFGIASGPDCNVFGDHCTGGVNPQTFVQSPLVQGPIASNGPNSWAGFGSNNTAGILTLISSTNCSILPGYDFVTDCNSGTFFNANGAQQKPVLCLANQS